MSETAQAKTERKFLMSVDGEQTFMSLQQAGVAYSSLWRKVEIVGPVQEPDGVVRAITSSERDAIRRIADECDADK